MKKTKRMARVLNKSKTKSKYLLNCPAIILLSGGASKRFGSDKMSYRNSRGVWLYGALAARLAAAAGGFAGKKRKKSRFSLGAGKKRKKSRFSLGAGGCAGGGRANSTAQNQASKNCAAKIYECSKQKRLRAAGFIADNFAERSAMCALLSLADFLEHNEQIGRCIIIAGDYFRAKPSALRQLLRARRGQPGKKSKIFAGHFLFGHFAREDILLARNFAPTAAVKSWINFIAAEEIKPPHKLKKQLQNFNFFANY